METSQKSKFAILFQHPIIKTHCDFFRQVGRTNWNFQRWRNLKLLGGFYAFIDFQANEERSRYLHQLHRRASRRRWVLRFRSRAHVQRVRFCSYPRSKQGIWTFGQSFSKYFVKTLHFYSRPWMWLYESYTLIAVSKMTFQFTISPKNLVRPLFTYYIVQVTMTFFTVNKTPTTSRTRFSLSQPKYYYFDISYKIAHDGNDRALMQHGTRLRSAWPQVGVVSSLLTSSDSVKFGLMLGSWTAPPTGATSMASRTSWLSLIIDFRCSGDWCWVVYNRSRLMSSLTLLPQSASLPQPPWPPVPELKMDI